MASPAKASSEGAAAQMLQGPNSVRLTEEGFVERLIFLKETEGQLVIPRDPERRFHQNKETKGISR